MSRAFVKELDDVLPADPVVQRPQSRPMTAAGLARFKERLAGATDDAQRRSLSDVVASAVVVGPPEDRSKAAFGAKVTVRGAGPRPRAFTIVGEDELDVESGKIGVSSPLGQALMGAKAGDVVEWRRPAGPAKLTVETIEYDG